MDSDARTLWCGNLSDKVTEELLFELFLQVAPLERVKIPQDKQGRKSNFGFVTLKHEVSVGYAVKAINGTRLYDRPITVKPRKAKEPGMGPGSGSPQRSDTPPAFADKGEQRDRMKAFGDLVQMGQMMQLHSGREQPYQNQRNRYDSHHGQQNSQQHDRQHDRFRDRDHDRDRDSYNRNPSQQQPHNRNRQNFKSNNHPYHREERQSGGYHDNRNRRQRFY